ncbi:MAG: ATP-binding protein [Gammaproteobacteria bacterium]
MLQLSENEVINRLVLDNPWWEVGISIDNRFQKLPLRSYFELFYDLLADRSVNRAVILMGPRRVGKTVMVYHAMDRLIKGGMNGSKIMYLSLETPVYTGLSLEKILNLFLVRNNYDKEQKLVVFFDEIQYLKDWEVHLKSLVDSYPNFKFIATGSAAALRLKSRESGAGRFTEFMLPPLMFAEYLRFIDREDELIQKQQVNDSTEYRAININLLNEEFVNYLNYGGYPEAVFSETIKSDSARFIKSDIIDKVLLRDLPSLYGINDIQELNRLFTTIAYNTGNEVTLEALAQSSGVAKNTLKRYLEYLEAAFLIRRIGRVDENARNFKRATSFKVYLTNPSMRAALFGYIKAENDAMGALTETAVFSQWLHSDYIDKLYYARWKKGEIDMVAMNPADQKVEWCVEVKWSDKVIVDHSQIDGLIQFLLMNSIESTPLVTTKTKSAFFKIKGIPVEFKPSSLQVYTLGKNILQHKATRNVSA